MKKLMYIRNKKEFDKQLAAIKKEKKKYKLYTTHTSNWQLYYVILVVNG